MKNRTIILTAILSLVGCGGLSCTALAAGIPPFNTNVVNTPNVNVVNTATSPVPVQDAENPARNAVQQEVSLSIPPGGSSEPESSIPIPADKIFVLETVTLAVSQRANATLSFVTIGVTGTSIIGGGQSRIDYNLLLPTGVEGSIDFFSTQALRLYAQPRTNLVVHCVGKNFGVAATTVIVAVSGYFVSA